jgi:16S rRNA (guanine527-N7)-methyltransferase
VDEEKSKRDDRSPDETVRRLLTRGIGRLGLTFTDAQIESIVTYLNELKRWNQKTNLVGFRTDDALVRHGVLESLMILKAFPIRPGLRLMDIGSGAGFPGIPLKIAAPELFITLVEGARKKASFLKHACRLLQIRGLSVLQTRAEFLRSDPAYREAYDIVTARAVARLSEAVTLCTPFVKREGRVVLPVGPRWVREAETIRRPDLTIEKVLNTTGDRCLLILAKTAGVSRETHGVGIPEGVT